VTDCLFHLAAGGLPLEELVEVVRHGCFQALLQFVLLLVTPALPFSGTPWAKEEVPFSGTPHSETCLFHSWNWWACMARLGLLCCLWWWSCFLAWPRERPTDPSVNDSYASL